MEQATIPNLIERRNYIELEKRADEYLQTEGGKLINSVRDAVNVYAGADVLTILGHSELARAIADTYSNPVRKRSGKVTYEQTFFSQ